MTARTRRLLSILATTGAIAGCSTPRNNSSFSKTHEGSVRITATDSGFVTPDTLAAGLVHVVFENRASVIHEVMFIRLPDGMAPEDYIAAVRGGSDFPEGAVDCSGIGLTSPGEQSEMWLPLEPGRYLLACWSNEGLVSEPVRTVSVVGASNATAPPREDAVLRMVDFRYELVGELHAGAQVIRVETVGPSMHEVDFFSLHDGKTVDDFRAWEKADRTGPAPVFALGGALDSHDISRVVWFKRDFRPGRYVIRCSMPMVQNAPADAAHVTHADAGMIQEFQIGD